MKPTKWTETAIKQAFDNFVNKYDRLPTKHEMYEKYKCEFPRPLSVKKSLGITIGEYLEKNYSTYLHKCQSRIYGRMSKEYWVEDFKKQYIQLNKPDREAYNKLRTPGTPSAITLTRIVGVPTWTDLLEYCGFPINKKVELKGEIIFEPTLENYQKLNEKLQEIIKSFL